MSLVPARVSPKLWLWSTAAAVGAALVWAQFRSYDLLDGATYFLLYQDPADNPDLHTRFHLLARPFWLLCGQNIVAFRLLTLALATVACWVFARAWRRLAVGTGGLDSLALWLATLAGICWVPVALTYNSIATLLCLVALAALAGLIGPGGASAGSARRLVGALIFGGAIIGIFLTKPPAAAIMALAMVVLACCHPGTPRWLGRALVLLLLAGAVGAVLMIRRAISDPVFDADRVGGYGGITFSPQWIISTIERYGAEFVALWPSVHGDFLWSVVPTILVLIVALRGDAATARSQPWRSASLGLLLFGLAGALVQRRLWNGSFDAAVSGEAARFYILLLGSLLPVWLLVSFRAPGAPPEFRALRVGWVLTLTALPLLSSVGTTNTLYVSALHQTVFWSAAILLVAQDIAASFSARWFHPGIAMLLCVGAAGHIYSGHFWKPYMHQRALWQQTGSINIGYPATSLKVDPALAKFLRDVRAALDSHGYRPGDDVFGFFNLPGVIFAVGARQPGAPWYFGTWYHDNDTDGGKIRQVPLERRQRAWIITQADVTIFRRRFLEAGIDFPDGYEKIGQTVNPATGLEIGIWKPKKRR
jgi:hypothetical protein